MYFGSGQGPAVLYYHWTLTPAWLDRLWPHKNTPTIYSRFGLFHCLTVPSQIWMYILLPFFLRDVNKKKRPLLCVGVFFCLFSVMQKQGCLSLFLLSASPAGLSILSPLFFSSAKLFLSSHTITPPPPFLFSLVLSLLWCWAEVSSCLWCRAAGEGEEML